MHLNFPYEKFLTFKITFQQVKIWLNALDKELLYELKKSGKSCIIID